MDLPRLQRSLRDLIKGKACDGDEEADPYLRAVSDSRGLAMIQEIVVWWRAVDVERTCPLTAKMLARRGIFDERLRAFIRHHDISPYVDQLGMDFLEAMTEHDDCLIAAVAAFERALIKVKQGDATRHVVLWNRAPYVVLDALVNDRSFDENAIRGTYRMTISRDLPGMFHVEREPERTRSAAIERNS